MRFCRQGQFFASPVSDRLLAFCAVALWVSPHSASASPNDLLAHYRFQTNGNDALGRSPAFVLTNGNRTVAGATVPAFVTVMNPPFTNGVLYVNGQYEPNGHSTHYLGTGSIGDLNYESFSIAFQFYPLPLKRSAFNLNKLERKLNSWTHGRYSRWRGFDKNIYGTANLLTGGESYRWFGLNREDNKLQVTLNNQNFVHQFKGATVRPNRWHQVICSLDLKQRKIVTLLDGRQLETVLLPANFRLDIIDSAKDRGDRAFSFVNYSNGSVFYGYVASLEIFGHALTEPEMAGLSAELNAQRSKFPGMPVPWAALILGLAAAGALGFAALTRFRKTGRR
jgi:hypothetical protein